MGESSKTQYPRACEISTIERLKIVAKLHSMGFSPSRIAREIDYTIRESRADVAAIINRYHEIDNLDEHLKNVTARTGEQLSRLEELRATLAKQLDWSSEWTQQFVYLPDGSRVAELDNDGAYLFGPRRPAAIASLVSQMSSLDKQIGELLGLYHKQVDISIKLEQTETTQTLILEVIKECDPETYSVIRRRIAALKATTEAPKALSAAPQTYLDAEYRQTG